MKEKDFFREITKEIVVDLEVEMIGIEMEKKQKRQNGRYFSWQRIAVACSCILLAGIGGMALGGARGVGPMAGFYRSFSSTPSIEESEQTVEGEYQVSLESYYLDKLGIGQFLFSVEARDGEKKVGEYILDEASIKYGQDGKVKSFSSSGSTLSTPLIRGDGGKKQGILMEAEIPKSFEFGKDVIIFCIGKEEYSFEDIQVTSHEILYLGDENGKVQLSELSMLVENQSAIAKYLSDTIDNDKYDAYQPVAKVFYKDGTCDEVYMKSYQGCEKEGYTLVQFSPSTDLYERLEEGENMEEETFDRLWEYTFSFYRFRLKELEKITFGDISLEVGE